jgi:hypothetical protein
MDITNVKNKLGEGYKDYILEGIKYTATFSIQGEYVTDDDNKRIIESVTVDEKTKKQVTKYKVVFPRTEVKHTFDFTGCTLGQLASACCAGSSLVVVTANMARPLGIDAVQALNGSTTMVKSLLEGKVRLVGSPKDKLLKQAEKIESDEDLEAAIAALNAIKERRKAIINN